MRVDEDKSFELFIEGLLDQLRVNGQVGAGHPPLLNKPQGDASDDPQALPPPLRRCWSAG